MLTLREIFNKVSNHLLTQKQQSLNADGDCYYHTASGLKCAVGCLISTETYNPRIEGTSVAVKEFLRGATHETARKEKLLIDVLALNGVDLYESHVRDLCFQLQRIHDDDAPTHWPRLLSLLEEEFSPLFLGGDFHTEEET